MNLSSSFSTLNHHRHFYTNKNPQTDFFFYFKFPRIVTNYYTSSRNFTVSARLPTRNRGRIRKNHLRKKLQQQVPNINHHSSSLTLENPPTFADENDKESSNLGQNSSIVLNPVLVDQLKTWANHHANQDHQIITTNHLIDSKQVQHNSSSGFPIPRTFTAGFKIGISSVFCVFLVFIVFNKATIFVTKQNKEDKDCSSSTTSLDKEMLRRKLKARMMAKHQNSSSVEVILQDYEQKPDIRPPQLDKHELMTTILNLNPLKNDPNSDFDGKIQEIKTMARNARNIEKQKSNGKDTSGINSEPNEKGMSHIEPKPASFDVPQGHLTTDFSGLNSEGKGNIGNSDVLRREVPFKGSNLLDTEKLVEKKPAAGRIITSVKEARQYLQDKKVENQQPKVNEVKKMPTFSGNGTPTSNKSSKDTNIGENGNVSIKNANFKDEKEECDNKKAGEDLGRANREKWMEDNFHEFQPIVDKIRGGFTDNYMVAKEKVKEDVDDIVTELKMLQNDENETEFEWMKDEKLREIVFQVRENELMGRDPFYLMDAQDKALFFIGLEKKVEKENEELRHLHEYLHSNIENLDYGADGISLYDPPEKIIPRWKGPPPSTTMSQEFLDDYLHQRKSLFAETFKNSDLVKSTPQDSLQNTNKTVESKNLKISKTVIEGSDGSVKPGKKSGKEFWQHTKKWSRGFLDSYNAENDPETKAVMKDIGKDLDRWITEKEIQATADIMDKVPDRGKKFIAEKINKLKTEMELFGPQAVVSKYSEYGEEEEIDYYWWLDLPFLLCIELYINGDEDERIGFYSLEMASDLELDPKPHHIIAFEDAGDCKNFCYIIQAHMEMLGNGNAFVVPQLPKDTYQEAKTNGFNVTVIRKGELKLDVDQTLEEVEEKLCEIGSKMYHDKIMKGRNVDVDSVMKGVFGVNKPTKRSRSKKKLKKPTK